MINAVEWVLLLLTCGFAIMLVYGVIKFGTSMKTHNVKVLELAKITIMTSTIGAIGSTAVLLVLLVFTDFF